VQGAEGVEGAWAVGRAPDFLKSAAPTRSGALATAHLTTARDRRFVETCDCDNVNGQSERAVRFRGASMRLPVLWLFLIAAALLGQVRAAAAQSAYSYPWCAKYLAHEFASVTSCYFNSYQQCMTTLSGIGGYCIKSPYYQAAPTTAPAGPRLAHPRRHRHT
jgi:hypothetical protein